MQTFLTILAVICLIVAVVLPKQTTNGRTTISLLHYKVSGFIAAAVFFFLGLLFGTYQSVPAGYRGVLLQFGAVHGVLDEGAHFITPYAQHVDLMEVRTQKTEAMAAASSKDLQVVNADVAINFHVNPSTIGTLYRNVGPDYADRIINPAVQETLKAVVAKYTAEELIRLRDQVKTEVDQQLAARLLAYNIIVEPNGVSLKNFDFSKEFNSAIESKQVAQQSSEKQKYILAQAQLEAQTAVTTAKGEAESNRIKAAALSAGGGEKVLAREWITKWDGHLPQVQSGAGNGMILDLKGLNTPDGKGQ